MASRKKGSAEDDFRPNGDRADSPEGDGNRGFDAILGELQQIVDQLERADLPLEQSLAAFERGVGLSRQGQKILDAAEQRVEVLLRDGSTESLE